MVESLKKTLTPDQQKKMLEGRMAAKGKRLEIRNAQEAKADVLEALDKLSAEINIQLESVKDDVITVNKMMVALERAMFKDDWGKVASISAAIQAFTLNISRRVETCSAKATVANTILSALRVKTND